MDTFKDKQMLEDMYARGNVPWAVWKRPLPGHVFPKAVRTA